MAGEGTIVPTDAVPGSEQARLYRDRKKGLLANRVQLEARKIAGDPDATDAAIKALDAKIKKLEDMAKAAEQAGEGS